MDFDQIQQKINELQNNNIINNKEILFMVGKMFEMIRDQKYYIHSVLNDLAIA